MSAHGRQRASSIAVLHEILASATEASVAAQLHISIRTLRRFASGSGKMNWVTHTRLQGLAAELEIKRAAERDGARVRIQTVRRRERAAERSTERATEHYEHAAEGAVALT